MTTLFNANDKKQVLSILDNHEKNTLSLKLIFRKSCSSLLENSDLNVQGVTMEIAKELYGQDFKSGKSGYSKPAIDKIFKKAFIEEHFTLENTSTYSLKGDRKWSDFKKEFLSEKEEALCKEQGKSFFKRVHDRKYQMIANAITDIRNEQGIKPSESVKKKKSLAELVKSFKSQITNKIVENEFDKTAVLSELEELKNYIANIA